MDRCTHLEQLVPCPQALLLERVDIVREEALDTEDASLLTREPRTLDDQRAPPELSSGPAHLVELGG